MKRIGSLEALFNVISDRSGCTQNQIFGYILGGISWKMVFALAYTPFWKLNKCSINLAKNYNDKPGWTCFLYSFLKGTCKKTKKLNVLDTWSVTKFGSLIISENRCARAPFALGSLPHWQLLYPPTVNFVTLPNEEMLAGVGIDVQRSCGAENRAVIFVGNT